MDFSRRQTLKVVLVAALVLREQAHANPHLLVFGLSLSFDPIDLEIRQTQPSGQSEGALRVSLRSKTQFSLMWYPGSQESWILDPFA